MNSVSNAIDLFKRNKGVILQFNDLLKVMKGVAGSPRVINI